MCKHSYSMLWKSRCRSVIWALIENVSRATNDKNSSKTRSLHVLWQYLHAGSMMIRLRWLILTWENRGGIFFPFKRRCTQAMALAAEGWVVGVIQFWAVIPTSATGFIEINYSPRPPTHSSEIAAILAWWRPGQQPQQPEERAGGQTKERTARALMLSPALLCYN